jgi:hypothetical protein
MVPTALANAGRRTAPRVNSGIMPNWGCECCTAIFLSKGKPKGKRGGGKQEELARRREIHFVLTTKTKENGGKGNWILIGVDNPPNEVNGFSFLFNFFLNSKKSNIKSTYNRI